MDVNRKISVLITGQASLPSTETLDLLTQLEIAHIGLQKAGGDRKAFRLEIGQLVHRLQPLFRAQGERNGAPTLASELKRLRIPRSTAYSCLWAYEVSVGLRPHMDKVKAQKAPEVQLSECLRDALARQDTFRFFCLALGPAALTEAWLIATKEIPLESATMRFYESLLFAMTGAFKNVRYPSETDCAKETNRTE